jgi:hypothetical protein
VDFSDLHIAFAITFCILHLSEDAVTHQEAKEAGDRHDSAGLPGRQLKMCQDIKMKGQMSSIPAC